MRRSVLRPQERGRVRALLANPGLVVPLLSSSNLLDVERLQTARLVAIHICLHRGNGKRREHYNSSKPLHHDRGNHLCPLASYSSLPFVHSRGEPSRAAAPRAPQPRRSRDRCSTICKSCQASCQIDWQRSTLFRGARATLCPLSAWVGAKTRISARAVAAPIESSHFLGSVEEDDRNSAGCWKGGGAPRKMQQNELDRVRVNEMDRRGPE